MIQFKKFKLAHSGEIFFVTPARLIAGWPRMSIIGAILTILLTLLAVLYNPAWTDEVFYVEPGASLAAGKGFLSNGWSELGHGTTWGLSNPGVPVLLAGWFKIFGFGQFSSHTFFFVAQLAGAILIVRWAQARHLIDCASSWVAVALCMMLHSLAGNTIFHARHDAFALLLFAWFLSYAFVNEPDWRSRLAAFIFGSACVFLGLQFCGYFSIAAAGLFLWRRTREDFMSGLCLALGLMAGILMLRWTYGQMGVWQVFLENRRENFGRAFQLDKFYASKDFLVLIPACVGLLLAEGFSGRGWRNKVAISGWFGLALLLGIPVIIQIIGLWQSPFSWMITVPLLLVILPICSKLSFVRGGWFVIVVGGLCLFSCFTRLRELPLAIKEMERRKLAVTEFRRLAASNEMALGSMSLYYDLRGSVRDVYWPYDKRLPAHPTIAKGVNWMVLAEVDRPILTGLLGGSWVQVYISDSSNPYAAQGRYVILRRAETTSR